jgi:hypothetical protein
LKSRAKIINSCQPGIEWRPLQEGSVNRAEHPCPPNGGHSPLKGRNSMSLSTICFNLSVFPPPWGRCCEAAEGFYSRDNSPLGGGAAKRQRGFTPETIAPLWEVARWAEGFFNAYHSKLSHFISLSVRTAIPVDAFSIITSTFLFTGTITSFGSTSQRDAFAGA